MKKFFACLIVSLLLFFSLRFPQEAIRASREGMQLWLNVLLPTLLPFLILTGFLIKTNVIDRIFLPFRKIFRILFGLSAPGTYALLAGLLCGYPMGAKIASDLYEEQKISRKEALYLLTFANNASPAFIINYLYISCLHKKVPLTLLLGILFSSTFLCMLFFRFFVFHDLSYQNETNLILKKETSACPPIGTLIDVSIMNGFETITRLGGYILLFSLISAVIDHFSIFPSEIQLLLSGFSELTTGLYKTAQSDMPFAFQYIVSMALTSFGGFSILAQTRSVISNQLSIAPYFFAKILNAGIAIVLVLITSRNYI